MPSKVQQQAAWALLHHVANADSRKIAAVAADPFADGRTWARLNP